MLNVNLKILKKGDAIMYTKFLILGFLVLGVLSATGCLENKTTGATQTNDVKTIAPSDAGVTAPATAGGKIASSVEVVPSFDQRIAGSSPTVDVNSARGIVVSGLGKVRLTPDIAVFTAGFVYIGSTAQEASTENAKVMDAVVKAVKNLGVSDKDIKTQSANVWPEYDYGYRDEKGREVPRIIGYRAENTVSVTVRDIAKTGSVIDAVTGAGANQLYGVSFTLSENAAKNLQTTVLREAVLDATSKAQAIADALGIKKISPKSVVESGGYSPPIYRFDVAAAEKGAVTTPISPGETEVTASVTVTFDFEA